MLDRTFSCNQRLNVNCFEQKLNTNFPTPKGLLNKRLELMPKCRNKASDGIQLVCKSLFL